MTPSPAKTAAPPRPQLPAPGVALTLLSESVAHRTELATLELEEARDHACTSTLLAGATGALLLFTGFAFTLLMASLVWDDPHRGWWLTGLCAAYLAGTATTAYILVRRLRTWQPLGETRFQLQQDYQCLNNLFKSATR